MESTHGRGETTEGLCKPKKPEEEENTLESNTRNQKIWKQTYETTGRGKIW
jgi:hypothetical protein